MKDPVLIEEVGKDSHSHRIGKYLCHCGNEFETQMTNVLTGRTKSCGCYRLTHNNHESHKLTKSPMYYVWRWMKQVCLNPKNPMYPKYGGRGIKFCTEWDSFEGFCRDMCPSYRQKTWLRRYNLKEHFTKMNCYWGPIKRFAKDKDESYG